MKLKDILIIGGILLAALGSFFVVEAMREDGVEVVVRINGEYVNSYSLLKDGEYELNNGTNILCIKDGKAYMLYANCPDHKCIEFGTISKSGETITCLPNRLTITVVGGDNDVELIS